MFIVADLVSLKEIVDEQRLTDGRRTSYNHNS